MTGSNWYEKEKLPKHLPLDTEELELGDDYVLGDCFYSCKNRRPDDEALIEKIIHEVNRWVISTETLEQFINQTSISRDHKKDLLLTLINRTLENIKDTKNEYDHTITRLSEHLIKALLESDAKFLADDNILESEEFQKFFNIAPEQVVAKIALGCAAQQGKTLSSTTTDVLNARASDNLATVITGSVRALKTIQREIATLGPVFKKAVKYMPPSKAKLQIGGPGNIHSVVRHSSTTLEELTCE